MKDNADFILKLLMSSKRFFYKLILGELIMKQNKTEDQRNKVAKLIDLTLPSIALFLFVFFYLWFNLDSVILTLILCVLVLSGFKILKRGISLVLEMIFRSISDLKSQHQFTFNYVSSLSEGEFTNYGKKLFRNLPQVNEVREVDGLTIMYLGFKKVGIKLISTSSEGDILNQVKEFRQQLRCSFIHDGIIILKDAADHKLLKAIEKITRTSLAHIEIIDIYGVVNLSITHNINSVTQLSADIPTGEHSQGTNPWVVMNTEILTAKKRCINQLAVGIFLILFGYFIGSLETLYYVLGVINLGLSIFTFYKYLVLLDKLVPGTYDNLITNN